MTSNLRIKVAILTAWSSIALLWVLTFAILSQQPGSAIPIATAIATVLAAIMTIEAAAVIGRAK